MPRCFTRLLTTALLLSAFTPGAEATEQPFRFEAFKQQSLPGKLAWPDGTKPEQVKDWIVLIHGSGAPNMDEDLAVATADKQPNPFFKYLSDQLVKQGFGVIRYDKRSYLVHEKAVKDPAYANSPEVQAFAKLPMTYLIEDAKACLMWARKAYPQARINLVGHSEGTNVALQVARLLPKDVHGLGLIGFYDTSFDTTVFEQGVYRPQGWFDELDANHDGKLEGAELNSASPLASALKLQMGFIDRDHDGALSLTEFRAANMVNLLVQDLGYMAFRQDEANYPRPHQFLASLTQPVAFFVGELDNQTPAYQTQAVEMANEAVWHKKNLFFDYFPGLGHGLDKRSRYEDIVYQHADTATLAKVADRLAKVLKNF